MSLTAKQPATTMNDDNTTTTPLRLSPQLPSKLSRILTTTTNVSKLLPIGTLMVFQLLTPIFTNKGSCNSTNTSLTTILLVLLAVSCLLISFTDSIKSNDGQIYYGFATFKGIWIFDYYDPKNVPDLRRYRLSLIDWAHAVLTVVVFGAVALRDRNVVSCFYPSPGPETHELLDILPIGVGFISSALFVVLPTRRHGIGHPITKDDTN